MLEMNKTHEQVEADINYWLEKEWNEIVTAYRKSCYSLSVAIKIGLDNY